MRCTRLFVAVFCLTLAGGVAYAQAPAAQPATPPTGQSTTAKAGNSQNQRMTDCNAEAKTEKLAGQKRKDFMKVCLASGVDAAKQSTMTQQQKMTKCNADATAQKLKGDDRKKFMSNCLKAAPAS
jgi:psiF repeat